MLRDTNRNLIIAYFPPHFSTPRDATGYSDAWVPSTSDKTFKQLSENSNILL